MAHKNQPIGEAFRQWTLARIAFATSLQTYLDAISHFEVLCTQIFNSRKLEISNSSVHVALDEEVTSLAAYTSSILSTRVQLLRLKNTSTLISPINILPPEILSRIFITVVDSCRTFRADLSRRDLSINQVNVLSGICSSWRSIALNTHQLWSYIDFKSLLHTDHMSLWLDRARGYPLDVVDHSLRVDNARSPGFGPILSRMERVRSMISRSSQCLMEQWISRWCGNGAPRTLTTLALRAPSLEAVEFPAQSETINQQHLNELLYSLNTLYLSYVRVNWDSLKCHNIITLSLQSLKITTVTLGQLLFANPNLQNICLRRLTIADTFDSAAVPPIHLRWLNTLDIEGDDLCQLFLTIVALGDRGLTLKMCASDTLSMDDEFRRNFIAFCRRYHITTLHCCSPPMLQDAITAESKIEVLCFHEMRLDNSIYDLIVPPTNSNNDLGHSQSRLPYLRSLYLAGCRLNQSEGLRRVITTCLIREVGIDYFCQTESQGLRESDDFENWIGPGINASFVFGKKEAGYNPFKRQ